jgi:hypothetical protein
MARLRRQRNAAASSVILSTAAFSLPSILCLRCGGRLPLHVRHSIGSAAAKRHNMIPDVARTRAARLARRVPADLGQSAATAGATRRSRRASFLRHSRLAQASKKSDFEQGEGLWDPQIYGGVLQSGDA